MMAGIERTLAKKLSLTFMTVEMPTLRRSTTSDSWTWRLYGKRVIVQKGFWVKHN
jgi:hypothetical protein